MHRLVIASVTLIGLVGAAVVAGYLFLFSAGSDRAATLAPAETAVYVNVYLQPSSGQQMNLSRLIGRLPGFADEAALDEKVDQIVQNLVGGTGIDYRADVKPWIGDQLAIAAWPAGTDASEAHTLVIAEVRDPAAADEAVPRLAAAGGDASFETETYEGVELRIGATTSYAFVDDMVLIGMDAEALHAAVDARGGASLAESAEFRDAMERVPSDHLASMFVDGEALAGAAGADAEDLAVSTASAALVAEEDGLRLSGSAPVDPVAAPSPGSASATEPTLTQWMPAGTLAELTLFDVSGILEEAESAVAVPQSEDLGSALDTVRAIAAFGLGVDLDADVLPLLEGEVAVALAAIGDAGVPSGQLLLRPTDADAESTMATLRDRLEAAGATIATDTVEGVDVTTVEMPDLGTAAYAVTDGVVILALSASDVAASLEAHASGQTLAASDAYARAFASTGTHAGAEGYVDVAAVSGMLGDALTLSDDARDILSGIGTLALTLPSRSDHIEFHAVLTVDEP